MDPSQDPRPGNRQADQHDFHRMPQGGLSFPLQPVEPAGDLALVERVEPVEIRLGFIEPDGHRTRDLPNAIFPEKVAVPTTEIQLALVDGRAACTLQNVPVEEARTNPNRFAISN